MYYRKRNGFTIVELLIVIVVIGILASITVVAYGGISSKARDTQNKTEAANIAKVAEIMNVSEGFYPTGTNDATLTTSFNSGTISRLPSGVAVKYDTRTDQYGQDYNILKSNAEATPRSYFVRVCSGGLVVFYPKRSGTSAATSEGRVIVGAGCPPVPTTPN